MTIQDFFDAVYLINLDYREDRKVKFYKQLEELKIPWNVKLYRAISGDRTGAPGWWTAGNGAWGCYRSHFNLLEQAINEERRNILFLEDDALFVPDFVNRLEKTLDELPDDWDFFYLGGQFWREEAGLTFPVSDRICRAHNVNRTHAYAINGKAFKLVYDHLLKWDEWGQSHHIDHHYGVLHESALLNVYAAYEVGAKTPWLVAQDEGSSNISGHNDDVRVWESSKMTKNVSVGDGVQIQYATVGWGEVGLNGALGYEEKKVEITGVPSGVRWISAHAPSRIVLNNSVPIYLFGGLNRDAYQPQTIVVDKFNCGNLRYFNDKTRAIVLKPGKHVLETIPVGGDNRQGHTVWGVIDANFCPNVDLIVMKNVCYPVVDIMTNGRCGRKCAGCNQAEFMKAAPDYEFTPEDAVRFVEALRKYDRKVGVTLSGGEPALWTHKKAVSEIFRKSDRVVRSQIDTSVLTRENIDELKSLFDHVCCSVRQENLGFLSNRPKWLDGCTLWDQRIHAIQAVKPQTPVLCCCVSQGVTVALIGNMFYPCLLAKNLELTDEWNNPPSLTLDEYLSGEKTFPLIGTFKQCPTCVNNMNVRKNGVIALT